MRGQSFGYKKDISDRSLLDWCIYRKLDGYMVAKVESRLDEESDAVIPYVEPAHHFTGLIEARGCYALQGAIMKVLAINYCTVEVEQTMSGDRYRFTVFEQSDKRLYCQSPWCKSRSHFLCEHVQFVRRENVQFVPGPPLTPEEIDSILDY